MGLASNPGTFEFRMGPNALMIASRTCRGKGNPPLAQGFALEDPSKAKRLDSRAVSLGAVS
jgi:hypothetical protein